MDGGEAEHHITSLLREDIDVVRPGNNPPVSLSVFFTTVEADT